MRWRAGGNLKPVTRFEKRGESTLLVVPGIRVDSLNEIVLDGELSHRFRGKTALLCGTKSSIRVEEA